MIMRTICGRIYTALDQTEYNGAYDDYGTLANRIVYIKRTGARTCSILEQWLQR